MVWETTAREDEHGGLLQPCCPLHGLSRKPTVLFALDRVAGSIRADLKARGVPIGAYDLLIAGYALARSLTLITGNVKEFRCVPDLSCED